MKKLFALLMAVAAHMPLGAQQLKTSATPTLVVDTLHYYLNKYYFKTGNSSLPTYPSYRSDASATIASTAITYCCSRFDVPAGETVTVTGLEGLAQRAEFAHPTIPITLYLFNINASTGLPVMPPIDSVMSSVNVQAATTPSMVGGDFTSTLTAAARVMTGSFAVGIRNTAGAAGDYARLMRTAGLTGTNTAATAADKYSEGRGSVRFNGTFYSTRDFNLTGGFGVGTDYEFMVAPRVKYELQASQAVPAHVFTSDNPAIPDTVCTRSWFTFTNTSSPFYEHVQYNLNQFYRKWNLYSPFPASVSGAFSSDSSITWHFEFYDIEHPPRDSRVFLPYVNADTAGAATGLSYFPDCFTNQFRARLKPMSAFGRGTQLSYNQDFEICLKFCNGDNVGLRDLDGFSALQVYPNPAVNGKTLVSGLQGKNTISVYTLLGQQIFSAETEREAQEIDLNGKPAGVCLLKIRNRSGQERTVRIMHLD